MPDQFEKFSNNAVVNRVSSSATGGSTSLPGAGQEDLDAVLKEMKAAQQDLANTQGDIGLMLSANCNLRRVRCSQPLTFLARRCHRLGSLAARRRWGPCRRRSSTWTSVTATRRPRSTCPARRRRWTRPAPHRQCQSFFQRVHQAGVWCMAPTGLSGSGPSWPSTIFAQPKLRILHCRHSFMAVGSRCMRNGMQHAYTDSFSPVSLYDD